MSVNVNRYRLFARHGAVAGASYGSDQKPASGRFGVALRNARMAKGASQHDIERSAGLDHSYVAHLEHDRRQPSRQTVARIVAALDLVGEDAARLYHAAGLLTPDEWAASP